MTAIHLSIIRYRYRYTSYGRGMQRRDGRGGLFATLKAERLFNA